MISMAWVKFTGHTGFLPHEVSTFFERVCLRSAFHHKRMLQPGHIQLEKFSPLDQSPISSHYDLGRCEARIFNRFGYQDRVEGFPWLGEHFGFTLHQTHISMINAIQASQGLLRPFGSKPSDHAVDFDRCLHYLSRHGRGGKKADKDKQKPPALLDDLSHA